jgi:hypothetical protein
MRLAGRINGSYCITAVSIVGFAIFFTVNPAPIAASQSVQGTPPAPAGDKPVEQVRKNIQVFQGLPDSHLIPVMNLMGASLGVGCPHCHVREGNEWAFEKDDKKAKQTAREMIRMVQEINKANFKGAVEVSCYTCHHGQADPAHFVPLPVAFPAFPAGQPPRGAAPQAPPARAEQGTGPATQAPPGAAQQAPGAALAAVPPATELIGKFQQQINASALEKLTSRVAKGTFSDAQGNLVQAELSQKPPDKLLVSAITPQGARSRATSGGVAWMNTPQGVRDMPEEEAAFLRRLAGFLWPSSIEQSYPMLSVGRREKVGSQNAYVVQATTAGNRRERLFFDTQSGLLIRAVSITETPIGPITDQIDFGDYREVNGVKVPFLIQHSGLDRRADFTLKLTEVAHDVAVDDAKFAKPK